MRSSIVITTRPKRPGSKEEIRLFTMNKRQVDLFFAVAETLRDTSQIPFEKAAMIVQKTVIAMLGGKMPSESAPRAFLEMRLAFPTLRPRDILKLPRAGCPRGRVMAMVLQVTMQEAKPAPTLVVPGQPEPKAQPEIRRTILIEFDKDQADFYNEAIREIMDRDQCSKDDAWLWINNLIGRLFAGAEMKDGCQEMLLMRAVNLFPAFDRQQVEKMPLATEDDVRRWSFTLDRSRP